MTLSQAITKFWSERIGMGFTAKELRLSTMAMLGSAVAPSSTDRALRRLRQQGKINYEVINSNESIYRALPIAVEAASMPTLTNVGATNESV